MPPEEGEIEEEVVEELETEIDDSLSEEDPDKKTAESDEGEDDVVSVSIGDSDPSTEDNEPAPGWVKELRKNHRQTQKENRELKQKLESMSGADDKSAELGTKPTLESSDYDSTKFEQDLSSWHDRKRDIDLQDQKTKDNQKVQEQDWQNTLDAYKEKKSKLKVNDFDDSEAFVEETLSVTQQGMILNAAEDPALLIYAIGKNQKKAKELAAIKDPVKFAFAVAKLETQLKVTPRKASTQPEKVLTGTSPAGGTSDATLKRLRAKAEKTGDYSEVRKYNRDKKQKAS